MESVVFYDYDEICLIEDCRFRETPESNSYEEEMRSQPWFAVERGDVFPEQFPTFMAFPSGIDKKIWERFKTVHGDLFSTDFWKDVQTQLSNNQLPDFYPYPEHLRFRRQPLRGK